MAGEIVQSILTQQGSQTANTLSIRQGVLLTEQITCYPEHSPCSDCVEHPELVDEYKDQVHLPSTPQDEFTGVVLLLHPNGASKYDTSRPDDDHHPEHPKLHSRLSGDAGNAVRRSRVQTANYWLHHIDNHNTFRGPILPQSRAEKFQRVVYNAAGLIPEMAICFQRPGRYHLEALSSQDRLRIWQQRVVRVDNPAAVRGFIKNYLFEQEVTGIDNVVDEFIHTDNPITRWRHAKAILDRAAFEATDEIARDFEAFYNQELMPPTISKRAAKFVVSSLANHESEKSGLSRELQEVLRNRHAMAA